MFCSTSPRLSIAVTKRRFRHEGSLPHKPSTVIAALTAALFKLDLQPKAIPDISIPDWHVFQGSYPLTSSFSLVEHSIWPLPAAFGNFLRPCTNELFRGWACSCGYSGWSLIDSILDHNNGSNLA